MSSMRHVWRYFVPVSVYSGFVASIKNKQRNLFAPRCEVQICRIFSFLSLLFQLQPTLIYFEKVLFLLLLRVILVSVDSEPAPCRII